MIEKSDCMINKKNHCLNYFWPDALLWRSEYEFFVFIIRPKVYHERNIELVIFFKYSIFTNGSMASRSFILLLLRLRCDKRGQSLRAPRPLLIRLSLSSSFLSFGNLGKPLSVVRPTFIRLRDSKFSYSSLRPSICVARALSRFNSLTWKTNMYNH